MHNNSKQQQWKKRIPLLSFIAKLTLAAIFLAYFAPIVISNHHGDDGDPREEIAVAAGAVAAIARGVAVIGSIAAGGATAPAWVPAATAFAAGAAIVAASIALWDVLDGPEDSCPNCDGSGCNTCDPPDPDGCYDCDGSGCSTCGNYPPHEFNCDSCGYSTTVPYGKSIGHTCTVNSDGSSYYENTFY